MTVDVGWGLAIGLALLVGLAVAASLLGRLGLGRAQAVAALRAVLQLAGVSLIVTAAVATLAGATAFLALMFGVAVWTTTGRTGTRRCWPWSALAMAAGLAPVLAIVFATGAAPLNGVTIVALGGIVTGNVMTAHTLTGRRVFAHLADTIGQYEAALAIGLPRPAAIGLLADDVVPESLIPNLDQTRTVGLVTLPGAFIGVLLGGGSPLQAGASQVLVLVGIMAGQAVTVAVMAELIRRGRLIPESLTGRLHP